MNTDIFEAVILQLPNFGGLIVAILVLHRELRLANKRADDYYQDCVKSKSDISKSEYQND